MIAPSKTEFNKVIDRILEGPEYRHLSNSFRNYLDAIKESISRWLSRGLGRIFDDSEALPRISGGVSALLLTIGILAILAIVILIIVKVIGVFEKNSRVKEILGEKITKETTPQSLRNKALKYKEEKEYRQSIRYDFIALLLLMHERAIIYLEESQTNEELYNCMKKNSFWGSNLFYYIGNFFNYAWYGHKGLSEEELSQWSSRFEAVWNEVMKYEG